MLTFHYITDGLTAADNLSQRITDELSASKRVLWLLSGGSNAPIAARVMSTLSSEMQQMLTIGQLDERFGPPGHQDSNAVALANAGFTAGQANWLPMLTQETESLEACATAYSGRLAKALTDCDVVIAQFGIGTDGHIAGLFPGHAAIRETTLAYGFEHDDFTRITLTPTALLQIHAAYAFAFGAEKRPALQRLQDEDLPVVDQPAQLLKQLGESHLYSDQVSEQTAPAPEAGNPS